MRRLSLALGRVVACVATGASAQRINLTGTYRCIQNCGGGLFGAPAFVTQNGTAVNLVTGVWQRDLGPPVVVRRAPVVWGR